MPSLKSNNFSLFVFGGFLLLSLLCSLLFGFTHTPTWQDASQYSAYATNLVSGNGYSLDGKGFSNFREPGVPFFLALIYGLFGDENILAVTLAQVILLALVAQMFFLVFRSLGLTRPGIFLGVLILLFPSYGYYTHEVGSELLFTFFVTLSAYLIFLIWKKEQTKEANPMVYLFLGIAVGYASLVRIQFLFYFPLFFFLAILFFRRYFSAKKLLLALFAYAILIGGWSFICYQHTGSSSLTSGRPELILHGRAVRAELSYKELGQYFVAWVHKRVSSDYIDPMLARADLVGLTANYVVEASTTEARERIKQEDLATLRARPMHYLVGNIVEIAKLYYLEYLYTDYLPRVVRAAMYAVLYLFTLLGAYTLYRARKSLSQGEVVLVAIMCSLVLYNAAILSFFDTIPRYNTPFLVFLIGVGVLGSAVAWRNRKALRD